MARVRDKHSLLTSYGLSFSKAWKTLPILVAFILSLVPIVVFITTTNKVEASSGTPKAGVVIYQEDFSSGTSTAASVTPFGIETYTGNGPYNSGVSYTTNNAWASTAGRCNGWILSRSDFIATAPNGSPEAGCTVAAGQDGNGTVQTGWWFLTRLATAIGQAQGMSATDAVNNNVVASMTNNGDQPLAQTLQMATVGALNLQDGHFYTLSAYFGQIHCPVAGHLNWVAAQENLNLTGVRTNGVTTWSSSTPVVNPCNTSAGAQEYILANNTPAYVAKLSSTPILIPSDVNLSTLRVEIRNTAQNAAHDALASTGNDVAFDLPIITDVTPQLYKAFTPTTIQRGDFTTLTYNITNTDELDAKLGWNFTDNLPTGLTVVGTPVNGSGAEACGNFSGIVSGGSVAISGDLATGQSYCTVSLKVKVASAITYTNGAANFPHTVTAPNCESSATGLGLCGVLPPDDAKLIVTPSTLTPDVDSTPFETPITVDASSNDTVPAGSTITNVTPANPIQGSWLNNGDGTVTFTPANGFSGVAQATYKVTLPDGSTLTTTVTINVASSPTIPILVPDVDTTPYETPVTVSVLSNDEVEDGSIVTNITPNDPTQGTWTFTADGTVVFTPAAGFSGQAIATYEVTYPDNTVGMSTVTITVSPPPIVNPKADPGSNPNLPGTGYLRQPAVVASGVAAIITAAVISVTLLISHRSYKSKRP